MMFTSEHHPFELCIRHEQWLLTEVSVLFSFFHIFLRAYVYQTGTCDVTFLTNRYVREGTRKHSGPSFT